MVKRIDFHIHTISSEKDYEFDFSLGWLRNYVSTANLDAIAITNHDLFNKSQYLKIKKSLSELNCEVYPGMELSLEEGHVNIVFDSIHAEKLSRFSSWIERNKSDSKSIIDVKEYIDNMENWSEGIYIFELGKSNSLNKPHELSNVVAVGGVPNQLKFHATYLKDSEITPVLFSDAHSTAKDPEPNRNDIDNLMQKNTFLQVDNCSFEEIKICISDKEKISINPERINDVIEIGGHRVSTGLNLIIGKRGTGKTHFLKRIKNQYPEDDIYEIAQFETAKSEEYIEKQRKNQGLKSFNNWKDRYITQFTAIVDYLEAPKNYFLEEIDSYLKSVKEYARDSAKSKSSSKYKLTKETSFEGFQINSLKKDIESLKKLISSKNIWSYLKDPEFNKQVFIDTYNELIDIYIKKTKEEKIKEKVNEIISDVKDISIAKTGISKVEEPNFSKIISNNKIEESINKFLNKIIKEQEIHREIIYGYNIVVKLSPYGNATEFRDTHTSEAVKDDLIDPYLEKNYITFLNNLIQKKFYNSSNLAEYLMHLEVDLLDEDRTPASGGQAVGFALMIRLKEAKNNPIILIDEPEASLDNDYIKEDLIKAIKKLTKHSMVFVITHNSTLGALLEPDYLIVTKKNNVDDYQVLTGEFSSKKISDNLEETNSYDLFIGAMEAGMESYEKKGDIYEFLRN